MLLGLHLRVGSPFTRNLSVLSSKNGLNKTYEVFDGLPL
jgi:hypothetical protein